MYTHTHTHLLIFTGEENDFFSEKLGFSRFLSITIFSFSSAFSLDKFSYSCDFSLFGVNRYLLGRLFSSAPDLNTQLSLGPPTNGPGDLGLGTFCLAPIPLLTLGVPLHPCSSDGGLSPTSPPSFSVPELRLQCRLSIPFSQIASLAHGSPSFGGRLRHMSPLPPLPPSRRRQLGAQA